MFKRLLVVLALAIATVIPVKAQNFTTVTAASIQDSTGTLLPSGTLIFQATDTSGRSINYQAGGGGQVISTPVRTGITNGAIGVFHVANPTLSSPQNIRYHVTVMVGSKTIMDYPGVYLCNQTGACSAPYSFSFDTCVSTGACLNNPFPMAGIPGVIGPTGPTGPTGPPINFRGNYAGGTTYATGDAVSYTDGSAYISIQNSNTGHTPPSSPTFWSLLAAAGGTGPAGSGSGWTHEVDCATFAGADLGAKINACMAGSPSGSILSLLNFASTQTISTAVNISGSYTVDCGGLIITQTAAVTLSGTGASWIGSDTNLCRMNKNGNIDQIATTGTDNTVYGVSLNGNHASFTGNGIVGTAAVNVMINGSRITDEATDAIKMTTGVTGTIKHSIMFDTFLQGIEIVNNCRMTVDTNTFVRDNVTASSSLVIASGQFTTIKYINNEIAGNGFATNAAVTAPAVSIISLAAFEMDGGSINTSGGWPAIEASGSGQLMVHNAQYIQGGGVNGPTIKLPINYQINDNFQISGPVGGDIISAGNSGQGSSIVNNRNIALGVTGVGGKCGIRIFDSSIGALIKNNGITITDGINATSDNYGVCLVTSNLGHMGVNIVKDNVITGQNPGSTKDVGVMFDNTLNSGANFGSFNVFEHNSCTDCSAVVARINATGNTNSYLNNLGYATANGFRPGGSATDIVIYDGPGTTFATIPVAGNGSRVYCNDCTPTIPTTAGGIGGIVILREANQWIGTHIGVIYYNTTPVTVNTNTTGEQVLYNVPMSTEVSSTLRVGSVLKLRLRGTYSTPAGSAATINVKVYFCNTDCSMGPASAVAIYNVTSSANPGTVTNNPIIIDMRLTTVTTLGSGNYNSYEVDNRMIVDLGAATTSALSTFANTDVAPVTAWVPGYYQVHVAFSTNQASANSFTGRSLVIEVE